VESGVLSWRREGEHSQSITDFGLYVELRITLIDRKTWIQRKSELCAALLRTTDYGLRTADHPNRVSYGPIAIVLMDSAIDTGRRRYLRDD
jgi:hypothetical protein